MCGIKKFQSTLSRRERRIHRGQLTQSRQISIHALTKRATKTLFDYLTEEKFQSTLSRRERPVKWDEDQKKVAISIHALTKRATLTKKYLESEGKISIHALTKRATLLQYVAFKPCRDFNPRSHEESDVERIQSIVNDIISIHALTKRATDEASSIDNHIWISIHALTKRATI